MSFKKKPTVKEEMVRLTPEEQEVYFHSPWYHKLCIERRRRLIQARVIEWPSLEWVPPQISTH